MRVLLISLPSLHGGRYHNYMPPLGIVSIATYLKKKGYKDISVVDFNGMRKWDSRKTIIRKFSPDIIGISCMTTNYPLAIGLAKWCRAE